MSNKSLVQDVRIKAIVAFLKRMYEICIRSFDFLTQPRFSLKEQVFFAKRLSFLVVAGVTPVEGLSILREQMISQSHALVLDHILRDVTSGQSLAKSFAKFPEMFSDFAVHIIKIGESSGTLSQNLEYLAEELKKKQSLRRKIVGACVYPALITLATLGIIAFLMLYLFPKIMPIFISLRTTLPLSTRIVMTLSVFFQHWGLLIIGLLTIFIFGFGIALGRHKELHLVFDRVLLQVPIIGTMIQYYNIANISRTLGLLLKSGVSLSEALTIAADATKNLVFRQECTQLAASVTRGEKVSSYLRKRRHRFPDIFSHMVAVGEKSGTLSQTLSYLSEMYENEVEDFTKNLSTLIEPALMICMGVLVGFVAIAIITPIYSITQNLHG